MSLRHRLVHLLQSMSNNDGETIYVVSLKNISFTCLLEDT